MKWVYFSTINAAQLEHKVEQALSVHVRWEDEEETILLLEFSGAWTTEDYLNAAEEARQLILSKPYRVCLISSFEPNQMLPQGFLIKVYKFQRQVPPNQSLSVVVGTSPFVRSVFSVLQKVTARTGGRIRLVNTLDEARTLCRLSA
jgi:hypothetical protein